MRCALHRAGPRLQVPAVVDANAIPALMAMLSYVTEAENAMAALRAICSAPEGRDAAVAAGVPAAVVTAMATCNATARCEAALLLSEMCVHAWARVCGSGA